MCNGLCDFRLCDAAACIFLAGCCLHRRSLTQEHFRTFEFYIALQHVLAMVSILPLQGLDSRERHDHQRAGEAAARPEAALCLGLEGICLGE